VADVAGFVPSGGEASDGVNAAVVSGSGWGDAIAGSVVGGWTLRTAKTVLVASSCCANRGSGGVR